MSIKRITIHLTELEVMTVVAAIHGMSTGDGDDAWDNGNLMKAGFRVQKKIRVAMIKNEHEGNDVGVGAGTPTTHETNTHGYRRPCR